MHPLTRELPDSVRLRHEDTPAERIEVQIDLNTDKNKVVTKVFKRNATRGTVKTYPGGAAIRDDIVKQYMDQGFVMLQGVPTYYLRALLARTRDESVGATVEAALAQHAPFVFCSIVDIGLAKKMIAHTGAAASSFEPLRVAALALRLAGIKVTMSNEQGEVTFGDTFDRAPVDESYRPMAEQLGVIHERRSVNAASGFAFATAIF